MQTQSFFSASGFGLPIASQPTSQPMPQGGVLLQVLVVDDDEPVRRACAGIAETLGCRVRTAASVAEARYHLSETQFDVVFLDVRLPESSGEVLLHELRRSQPHAFVVMMTAFATVSSAVELMRSGAGEFLQKPFALAQITEVLANAAQRRQFAANSRMLTEQLRAGLAPGRLVGSSEVMQKLFRMVAKVALARHPALLIGERGTGKELIARTIHANGLFPAAPFVPVDCDSLTPEHLEQELFGSEAETPGGTESAPGLLVRAGEGTVYLAEIGYLEAGAQARLVRSLSERQVRPSPTAAAVPLQARILASSSRDLLQLVEGGKFRKDLYYRLNIVTLRVPPLRERVEDIPLLAELFLQNQRQEQQRPFRLSDDALSSLLRYHWAGNVEELQSLLARACGLSSDTFLHFGDMSTEVKNFVKTAPPALEEDPAGSSPQPLLSIQELERRAIQDALRQLDGDKVLVAKCLGIGKTTLYRKLKEYGLADEGATQP